MALTRPAGIPGGADFHVSIARIRDHWLGGRHHSDRDRIAADRVLICAPYLPFLVRAQRAMQQRMVRYLIRHGVRQFLDLDSGVPTGGHVHEVAQPLAPEARVVYVDNDPRIVRDGQYLLEDNENTAYLHADVRSAEQVLEHPDLHKLIDLHEPVAVMMIDTLLHVPDQDNPAAMITAYTDAMCSGSYLSLSQFSQTPELLGGLTLFAQMFGPPPTIPLREPEQFAQLFTGLTIVDPGIVPVPLWHPDSAEDVNPDAERVRVYAGVGHKP